MRLVCPNCDAEYEVDASAIPETGRDVQCSNCGHGWFQQPPGPEEEIAAEEALFEPPPPLAPPPEPMAPAEDPEEDLPPLTGAPAPAPRALDESLLAVLREEAERETNARRAEAPPAIEMQVELGLAEPQPPTPEPAAAETPASDPVEADPVADRIARIKGVAPAATAKPASRREMLPEIEEINTTLRASSERRGGEAGAVADSLPGAGGASSFRSGFLLMILAALVVVVLYVMAPKLAEQIPAAKGALESYVGMIDGLRLWLDGLLRG